jgi:hypothetical protein
MYRSAMNAFEYRGHLRAEVVVAGHATDLSGLEHGGE